MPHLPESARLWLERAEIDYIGPFVKAWAAFNAWDREASGARRVRKDRTAGCEKVVGIRFALHFAGGRWIRTSGTAAQRPRISVVNRAFSR